MLTTELAPGVLYQRVDAGAAPVTALRTDIAGFVGIAERGPIGVPVPIGSWQHFVSWFGGYLGVGYLAYAVRAFLENGGTRCWVVRVTSDDPEHGSAAASVVLEDGAGPAWRISASSHGTWGNQLSLQVREHLAAQVHATEHDVLGNWTAVPSLAGFADNTVVRISQPGRPTGHRIVAAVDATESRLYWVHPDVQGTIEQRPGEVRAMLDPQLPILLESLTHRLVLSERGRLVRTYSGLSLAPQSPSYGPAVLPHRPPVLGTARGVAGATPPEPLVIEELRPLAGQPFAWPSGLQVDPFANLRLEGGTDGLSSLVPADFVGVRTVDGPPTPDRGATAARGLASLDAVDEVAILAVPDIHVRPVEVLPPAPPSDCLPDPCLDPAPVAIGPVDAGPAELPPTFTPADVFLVQAAMVEQAERLRDRFAVLDVPFEVVADATAGLRGALDWRSRFDTAWAALNYPWLEVADPIGGPGAVRVLPSCGHAAGQYADTDLELGVHRAPANRPVTWTLGPTVPLTEEHHAVLNRSAVNVWRTTGGRGVRLLGARTLSSDPSWRFVNVRRLMAMIEQALDVALRWAVFEPNNFLTRARATLTATFFLNTLVERGMLAGTTADESFFVKCDLDNNPAETRDLGRLLVEVGVAPSQPFEFVIVRVGRVRDAHGPTDEVITLGATGTEAR